MGQIGGAFQNLGSSLSGGLQNLQNIGEANWGDLSGGEKLTRLGMGAAKGLGQGYQNMQQQNAQMRQGGGGGMPSVPIPQTPAIQFASTNFTPGQNPNQGPPMPGARTRNPYFYGYGEGG